MGPAFSKSLCILCYISYMKSGMACCFIYNFSFRYLSCFYSIQSLSLFSPFFLNVFLFFPFLPTIFHVLPFLFYFLLLHTFVSMYFFFLFIFPLLTLVSFISHSPSLMFFHFSWYPLLFLSLHHYVSFTPVETHTHTPHIHTHTSFFT